MDSKKDLIILGIDPGTTIMGYGIIKCKDETVYMITMGVIELQKFKDHYKRLQYIFQRTLMLIDEYKPNELAIESPFYGNNVQSMLKLGRAQGTAISAALYRDLPIFEYAPRKVKQSITGNGNASKIQVANMLRYILKLEELPARLDATDGLAVALCHYYQKNKKYSNSKCNNWEDFIKNNPGRIRF